MENQFVFKTAKNNIEIRCVEDGIFRVRLSSDRKFKESLLSRYNLLQENPKDVVCNFTDGNVASVKTDKYTVSVDKSNDTLTFAGGRKDVVISLFGQNKEEYENEGFHMEIDLDDAEKLYGMGDEDRSSVMKRGKIGTMLVTDYVAYGPIPYMMSSFGWGILVNCTYMHTFDMGCSVKDKVLIDAEKGVIDFYVFIAEDMKQVLNLYTNITGKPFILPKSAYGFLYMCNDEYGARDMLQDCVSFRKYDIPCDIIGLEPGWMEKFYDYSIDKKWDPTRFYIPYWFDDGYTGTWSFFFNLRKMGYKLNLWLCIDYDLLWEEEGTILTLKTQSMSDRLLKDEHFISSIQMDKGTKPGVPWFDHLKKFIDNGAIGFKLDAANMVLEHPDRLWAGKYLDEEVHNVYNVILSKQMNEGFRNYTQGRRGLIYTPCLYAGTQRYAATWAGDTGGDGATVASVLNLAMCGCSNSSCDMDVVDPKAIHYAFLLPWTKFNGFKNWQQPWFMGEELEETIRKYSKLRSSLFPYIYSNAHVAYRTGLAMARPLCLMYPEDSACDNIMNEYMLGENLLVGVFDMNIYLPDGKWYDFWSDEIYEGNRMVEYKIPSGAGGALFVKAGSIVPMQKPMPHLDKQFPDCYNIHIYPGGDAEFELIEDDGVTFDYEEGKVLNTKMLMSNSTDIGFDFTLCKREGSFGEKKTDIEYDVNTMSQNHISNVPEMPEVPDVNVIIHGNCEYKVEDEMGSAITTEFKDKTTCFTISKEIHKEKNITFKISKIV